MAQATLEVPSSDTVESDATLYRHTKRPEWGVAVIAWERGRTRGYQFEDGNLRKIREGYYKLLEPAEGLGERAELIRANLRKVVEADADDSDTKVIEAVCPFSEQIELFTELYPKGFQDPEWIEDHRRTDGSALKRHREPIAEEAQEALSADRFKEHVSGGKHEEMADIIGDLLARTDLVPIAHAKAVRGMDAEEKKTYVEAVANLLHGDAAYEERFKAYLKAMKGLFGERPSWRIATALPGLVYPNEHTVVRRSAFVRQAGSIAPTAGYSRRATVRSYRNFQRVAVGTKERLEAAGQKPRDLLDVYDFVWATLRTSALDHLGTDR